MKKYLATAGALAVLGGIGNVAFAEENKDDSLTWYGITLYGTVDVGYTYMSYGAPLNDYAAVGVPSLIQKFSTRSISTITGNSLSQSKIGLKGIHEFAPSWSGVFNVETGFNPWSGQLSDGVKSVAQQNGVSTINQNTSADSSRAGQAFQGAAYAGVTNPVFGTLTIGRQNSLLLDNVLKYDPMGGSYAFSVIGYSGTTAGAGRTQDARLDNSVKWLGQWGVMQGAAVRAAGQYQSGRGTGSGGNSLGANLGGDVAGLSLDAAYMNKKGAIAAGAFPATSTTACPGTPTVANVTTAMAASCIAAAGLPIDSTVAGTVSDNWAWQAVAQYAFGPARLYAGYEDIHYRNPQVHLNSGSSTIGGYLIVANNNAFVKPEVLQVLWAGAKYSISKSWDATFSWYHYNQNQYQSASTAPVCDVSTYSSKYSGACSGQLNAYSAMTDYRFDKHFDIYAGMMYSHVAGGQAAGYAHTFNMDPTIGGRFRF